jgi:hypothetical protein
MSNIFSYCLKQAVLVFGHDDSPVGAEAPVDCELRIKPFVVSFKRRTVIANVATLAVIGERQIDLILAVVRATQK